MPSPLFPYLPGEIKRLIEPVQPELVLGLLTALESIAAQSQPTAVSINAAVKGVSSHRVPVYETASYILGDLATYDQGTLQALVELSHSTDSRVRHNALLCLRDETPTAAVYEMLERSLRDKSSRVRRKAADWAGRLRFNAVLPAIHQALQIESNAETRYVMAVEVQRLQNAC